MQYWLMKSEPSVYSISQLKQENICLWDGVRNYQAHNFLRAMKVGDRAFFYHSNCKPPGIVGLMTIKETLIIDPSQFDPLSPYYDSKSTPVSPRWQTVKVEFLREFAQMIALENLRKKFNSDDFLLLRKGNRLSVMLVPFTIAETILEMVD